MLGTYSSISSSSSKQIGTWHTALKMPYRSYYRCTKKKPRIQMSRNKLTYTHSLSYFVWHVASTDQPILWTKFTFHTNVTCQFISKIYFFLFQISNKWNMFLVMYEKYWILNEKFRCRILMAMWKFCSECLTFNKTVHIGCWARPKRTHRHHH